LNVTNKWLVISNDFVLSTRLSIVIDKNIK